MKRNIFAEIQNAQQYQADFATNYDNQNQMSKLFLKDGAKRYNNAFPRRKQLNGEMYYKQLLTQYKKISGTTLPFVESQIVNSRGDVILIHRDYGDRKKMLLDAITFTRNAFIGNNFLIGFYGTLSYIATGGKFVWETKGQRRGIETVVFGKKVPGEKKARRSYIGKQGLTPEELAHDIWEYEGGNDIEILDGVIDAILTIDSKTAAEEKLLNDYIEAHEEQEYNEAPF